MLNGACVFYFLFCIIYLIPGVMRLHPFIFAFFYVRLIWFCHSLIFFWVGFFFFRFFFFSWKRFSWTILLGMCIFSLLHVVDSKLAPLRVCTFLLYVCLLVFFLLMFSLYRTQLICWTWPHACLSHLSSSSSSSSSSQCHTLRDLLSPATHLNKRCVNRCFFSNFLSYMS